MNKINTDCIFYDKEKNDCTALKTIYCFSEKCGFYKPSREYNKDGTRKQVVNGDKSDE